MAWLIQTKKNFDAQANLVGFFLPEWQQPDLPELRFCCLEVAGIAR